MAVLEEREGLQEKKGVAAEGDTLHLREVRESDAGTYVLRSVKYYGQCHHYHHCHPDHHHHHHHLYDYQGGEQPGIGKAKCACDRSPPSQVRRNCHHNHHNHHDSSCRDGDKPSQLYVGHADVG